MAKLDEGFEEVQLDEGFDEVSNLDDGFEEIPVSADRDWETISLDPSE